MGGVSSFTPQPLRAARAGCELRSDCGFSPRWLPFHTISSAATGRKPPTDGSPTVHRAEGSTAPCAVHVRGRPTGARSIYASRRLDASIRSGGIESFRSGCRSCRSLAECRNIAAAFCATCAATVDDCSVNARGRPTAARLSCRLLVGCGCQHCRHQEVVDRVLREVRALILLKCQVAATIAQGSLALSRNGKGDQSSRGVITVMHHTVGAGQASSKCHHGHSHHLDPSSRASA